MDGTAMDSILKKLEQLINFKDNLIVNERYQIQSLYNQLRFLGAILKDVEEKHHENSEAENLAIKISGVAYETGEIIHPAVANFVRLRESNKDKKIGFCLNLSDIMEQIRPIEVEVMQFYDKMYQIQVLEAGKSSDGDRLSMGNRTMVGEEIMVGFDDEVLTIKKRLAGGKKQLDIIPIVGMPGLVQRCFNVRWSELIGSSSELTSGVHTYGAHRLSDHSMARAVFTALFSIKLPEGQNLGLDLLEQILEG
ncbi:hypothetical protein TEA_009842 [Camellia sinensis var. sinensis]|uniref:Disease resistance N-terminal domain-containing protein n=1 Tax=Camellia sinensis var. sinensis TaxID=542762 RepID=A0A4S4DBD8_CAMSN|nr:hypothetical protein TEA_009842 [Camellia sinensis var. sinensis]